MIPTKTRIANWENPGLGNRFRPRLETLPSRTLPSAANAFLQTNLVSDQAGVAQVTDPLLVNAWGIGLNPAMGAFWVSDNGTGKTTLYAGDVAGSKFANAGLVVSGLGNPTGQVFNPTTDFKISAGGATAAAV